jgi:hypothetical protein
LGEADENLNLYLGGNKGDSVSGRCESSSERLREYTEHSQHFASSLDDLLILEIVVQLGTRIH